MAKQNKVVKFWPKLLSRIIDILIIGAILTGSAYFMFTKVAGQTQLKAAWMFYVWAIGVALAFFVFTIGLPLIWNGKTIGNFITRTKIVANQNLRRSIIKRELLFGWAWVLLTLLFMALINHTLLLNAVKSNTHSVFNASTSSTPPRFVGWDAVRVSIFSTAAGIILISQMISAISGLVKKSGISFHDEFAGSKVVWINKFEKEGIATKKKEIQPKPVKNNPVVWIEGGSNV